MTENFKHRDALTEVAPGFFETRRRILSVPAWLAGLAVLGRAEKTLASQEMTPSSPMAQTSSPAGRLEWESFLKECVPVAERLYKDPSAAGQDAYLHWIASMISRTQPGAIPRAKKVGRFGTLDPSLRFGVSYSGKPFFVVEWQMDPGAFLPPHCHPNASVCTLGIEGEARIRNYDVIGDAPEFTSRQTFRVRETHDEIISAGRINTLSSKRDNIHSFQAGKSGALGIDIGTLHGPDVGFSFLELSGKPADAEQRSFDAIWKGSSV